MYVHSDGYKVVHMMRLHAVVGPGVDPLLDVGQGVDLLLEGGQLGGLGLPLHLEHVCEVAEVDGHGDVRPREVGAHEVLSAVGVENLLHLADPLGQVVLHELILELLLLGLVLLEPWGKLQHPSSIS